jgi:hypothetical protein
LLHAYSAVDFDVLFIKCHAEEFLYLSWADALGTSQRPLIVSDKVSPWTQEEGDCKFLDWDSCVWYQQCKHHCLSFLALLL